MSSVRYRTVRRMNEKGANRLLIWHTHSKQHTTTFDVVHSVHPRNLHSTSITRRKKATTDQKGTSNQVADALFRHRLTISCRAVQSITPYRATQPLPHYARSRQSHCRLDVSPRHTNRPPPLACDNSVVCPTYIQANTHPEKICPPLSPTLRSISGGPITSFAQIASGRFEQKRAIEPIANAPTSSRRLSQSPSANS